MSVPDRLVELVTERRIVPFVGAGFSVPSGLPSGSTLVKGLLRSAGTVGIPSVPDLESQLGEADLAEWLDILSPH